MKDFPLRQFFSVFVNYRNKIVSVNTQTAVVNVEPSLPDFVKRHIIDWLQTKTGISYAIIG